MKYESRPPSQRAAKLKERARTMRTEPTAGEHALWHHLRGDQFLPLRFRRQHRVGEFIVDFYCRERRLVIEVDGDSHEVRSSYDADRTVYLNSRGLCVLRFQDDDVLRNIDGVLEEIRRFCEGDTSP